MKKSHVFPILLALGLLLGACQDPSAQPGGQKIAVVDFERLMRDSVPGKEAQKFIDGRQAEAQAQLSAVQEKLEKAPDDQALQQEFQKVYATAMQRLQTEAQNAANIIQDAIKNVMNAYREKNGYDVIVYSETLASYSPQADITSAIMAEVDKKKVEFKPLPQPTPPEAAPAPAAAPKASEATSAPKPAGEPAKAPENGAKEAKPAK